MCSIFKNDKQKQNKQTKYKAKKKKLKKIWKKKLPLLLDEACWCYSKLLHLHKRMRREYQLTRQSNKARQ
jgi:hypothetical protein